jgi:alkyl sulfatase BDS1-like metallo-beta-lactamase superfamily hydrolase
MKHVIFADPSDRAARELTADAMEQLAYQAESSTWRNAYLTGAQELRFGSPVVPEMVETASLETIQALTLEMIFNYLAVRLNGPEAAGRSMTLNFIFTDTNETAWLRLENGALSHSVGRTVRDPDATVTIEREVLNQIITARIGLDDALASGQVEVEPQPGPLVELVGLLDSFSPWFAVIEP